MMAPPNTYYGYALFEMLGAIILFFYLLNQDNHLEEMWGTDISITVIQIVIAVIVHGYAGASPWLIAVTIFGSLSAACILAGYTLHAFANEEVIDDDIEMKCHITSVIFMIMGWLFDVVLMIEMFLAVKGG